MTDLQRVKDIDIVEYLASLGYEEASRGSGVYAAFLSPFGNDRNASFMVHRGKNRWSDYTGGGCESGDLIDLVQKLESVSWKDAIDIILKRKESHNVAKINPNVVKNIKKGTEIIDVCDIIDHRLISYLQKERKVNIEIARKYCDQISVRFPNSKDNPDKIHAAIGFQNNKEGYEVRNKYLKVATSPKSISTIRGRKSNELNVFEGFINFLSLLQYNKVWGLDGDVVVMNSLSFYNEVINLSREYDKVNLYLDNGTAGNEKTMLIRNSAHQARDCRGFYKGFEDINDLLTGKRI